MKQGYHHWELKKTSRPDVVGKVHRMKDSLMSEIHTPVEYNRKINSKWR